MNNGPETKPDSLPIQYVMGRDLDVQTMSLVEKARFQFAADIQKRYRLNKLFGWWDLDSLHCANPLYILASICCKINWRFDQKSIFEWCFSNVPF